jgi:hypothetical protein
MELGFVETLRRRWETLGIKNDTPIDIETDDQNSGAARQQILNGAIVKELLRDALKGKPPASLFTIASDLTLPFRSSSYGRYFQEAFAFAPTLSHRTIPVPRPLPL